MQSDKYAILGDIHSNWEALDTVLKDAKEQGVTAYVSVGDIVGYNADPGKCLDRIGELNCTVVRGNHDHYCSHDECLEDFHPLAANVVDWTRHQLTHAQIDFLRSLKHSQVVSGFTVVHSTLDMPEKWGYVFDTLDANAHFNYQTTSLCFHGHTHVPAVFEKQGRVVKKPLASLRIAMGSKYFINVGSIGQPRDGDPRASYVIYTPATKEILLRRLPYDIGKTQEKIRKAGLPERLAKRLELGK